MEEALRGVEEGEEHLSTIERAKEAVRAGEVASEDTAASVREREAEDKSMMGGETFLSPVTGVEGAEGSVAGRGVEVIGVIGMNAMAGDGLESGGLQMM